MNPFLNESDGAILTRLDALSFEQQQQPRPSDPADPSLNYDARYLDSCTTWCTYEPTPVSRVEDYSYPRVIRSRTISNNSLQVTMYEDHAPSRERGSSKSDDVYYSCEDGDDDDTDVSTFGKTPEDGSKNQDLKSSCNRSDGSKNEDDFQYDYVAIHRKPIQSESIITGDYMDIELFNPSLGSNSSSSLGSGGETCQPKTLYRRSLSERQSYTKTSDGYELPTNLRSQYIKKKLLSRRRSAEPTPVSHNSSNSINSSNNPPNYVPSREPVLYENSIVSYEPRKKDALLSLSHHQLSASTSNLDTGGGEHACARRTVSCSAAIPVEEPTCIRKISLPCIRSDGDTRTPMQVMRFNNNVWLAEASESFTPDIRGVDFNDIKEETIKKSKVWVKFDTKQKKKTEELSKKMAKEKQILVKQQQAQMDKLNKENAAQMSVQIKAQEKAKKPGSLKRGSSKKHVATDSKENIDEAIRRLEKQQEQEVEALTKKNEVDTLKVEKIHKSEMFEHERKQMKESHEQYKECKREAHSLQFAAYEQYQNNEVLELTKTIQNKLAEQIKTITAEIKDKDELARKKKELEERCDREIINKRKQLSNTQDIRREQLIAEHKEQMKLVDQGYLKKIKEFDENVQSVIEGLEAKIQKIGVV